MNHPKEMKALKTKMIKKIKVLEKLEKYLANSLEITERNFEKYH